MIGFDQVAHVLLDDVGRTSAGAPAEGTAAGAAHAYDRHPHGATGRRRAHLAAVETDRLYALTHGDFEANVRQRAEGILAALEDRRRPSDFQDFGAVSVSGRHRP
jgi:hypothetical protein